MKLVAVSQRVDHWPERMEARDALDQNLVRFLNAAGGLAVPVPNAMDAGTLSDWLERLEPEAVVLSGGSDIGLEPARDETDEGLRGYAERLRLPLLGICRGMQFLAMRAGIELQTVDGHVRTRHQLQGEVSTSVNSFHNLGFWERPPDYTVFARAEDGVVEGIKHNSLPWQGWMWHPERESSFCESDIGRFRDLLK